MARMTKFAAFSSLGHSLRPAEAVLGSNLRLNQFRTETAHIGEPPCKGSGKRKGKRKGKRNSNPH